MPKTITTIIILFSLIILVSGCNDTPESDQVCFKDRCFTVELAETTEARTQGLMFRDYLAADTGMLFIFPEEQQPTFWMKNVSLPLDIVWIDTNQKIVSINENVQPCLSDNCPTIRPTKKIQYVLEINGGLISDMNLKIGDQAKMDIN